MMITEQDKQMLLAVIETQEFKGALKNGTTKLTKVIFDLKAEVAELEDLIQFRLEELEELEDLIARRDLAEKYVNRNSIKNTKDVKTDDKVLNEDLGTKDLFINKMKGSEELSFKNYWKNSTDLNYVKDLMAKGDTLEEALEKTNVTLDKKQLIIRGVPIIENGRDLLVVDSIRHLF